MKWRSNIANDRSFSWQAHKSSLILEKLNWLNPKGSVKNKQSCGFTPSTTNSFDWPYSFFLPNFMTHFIDSAFAPNICMVQTTQHLLQHHDFDVHPDQAKTEMMALLQQQFQLPHPLILQKQEHKDRAIEYNDQPTSHFRHRTDACFTRKQAVICAVMTADCLPVFLADKNGQWVSAIHCGWRSLFQNIISKTFSKIKANPKYTQAYLGPCIQQKNYQVDEQFLKNFITQHPDTESAFTTVINGKSHADLQTIARIQLQQLGIIDIQASTDCTYELTDKYHSWRRDQNPKRMASLIWMT